MESFLYKFPVSLTELLHYFWFESEGHSSFLSQTQTYFQEPATKITEEFDLV